MPPWGVIVINIFFSLPFTAVSFFRARRHAKPYQRPELFGASLCCKKKNKKKTLLRNIIIYFFYVFINTVTGQVGNHTRGPTFPVVFGLSVPGRFIFTPVNCSVVLKLTSKSGQTEHGIRRCNGWKSRNAIIGFIEPVIPLRMYRMRQWIVAIEKPF